ncbi:MAG: hypothetical protein OEZ68_02470 [Gammaproteobacteria bacterium]|nr:hypothetical protein [Gammaproteobacteria bacterium]MDH5799647.1 hypothetical protein [Gammaproteobacteria bacterium]
MSNIQEDWLQIQFQEARTKLENWSPSKQNAMRNAVDQNREKQEKKVVEPPKNVS